MTPDSGQRGASRGGFRPTSGRWIREGLLESAQHFALSAMRALADEDYPVFYLHAGTAIEQLSKAFLAFHHPALICDRDFDSVLHACGFPAKSRRPATNMKTITAREALQRGAQLLPPLGHLAGEIDLFLDLRNGVAHFILLTSKTAARDRVPFFKAVSLLLPKLSMGAQDFWGDYLEVVQLVLDENATDVQVKVTGRILSAKAAFEDRYAELDDKTRRSIIKAIESSYVLDAYEEDLACCPACESMGVASGTYEVEWKADYEYDGDGGYQSGVYPEVTLYPGRFNCKACGLELDGDDELKAAGMGSSWEIEDVNPKDFHHPLDDDDY